MSSFRKHIKVAGYGVYLSPFSSREGQVAAATCPAPLHASQIIWFTSDWRSFFAVSGVYIKHRSMSSTVPTGVTDPMFLCWYRYINKCNHVNFVKVIKRDEARPLGGADFSIDRATQTLSQPRTKSLNRQSWRSGSGGTPPWACGQHSWIATPWGSRADNTNHALTYAN